MSSSATVGAGVDSSVEKKILDLGTSDRDIIQLMQNKFSRDDLSFSQQQELQYLFSVRQQKISLISNLLRSIFDAAANVVRNMRS